MSTLDVAKLVTNDHVTRRFIVPTRFKKIRIEHNYVRPKKLSGKRIQVTPRLHQVGIRHWLYAEVGSIVPRRAGKEPGIGLPEA